MTTSISCSNGLILEIADDDMSASISLNREENSTPVQSQDILDALKSSKILLDDGIKKRVQEFVERCVSDEDVSSPFVIAKGTLPYEGQDELFQWDPTLEEQKKAWEDDSQISYYNMNNIITVEQDVVIGTIQPVKPQRKGQNITGKVLKPRNRPPTTLKLDHTLRLDEADPTKLISNVPGRVNIVNNSMSIDDILTVKGDVGFATGNINSDVAVHITGSIPDRFEVHSKKSISVELAIEAAFVEAGEDVNVRRGIVGRHAGKVYAKNDIIAKYCSEANIVADGNLMITSQLLNCNAYTNGKFVGTHASIIGGHLYTKQGGEATDLGSDANTPTYIFIGPCPTTIEESSAIDEKIHAKRELIKCIREKVQPLLDNIKQLAPRQKEQATELMFKVQEAETNLEEEENRKKELARSSDMQSEAKFSVSGTIYTHVTISFGKKTVSFRNDFKGPVTLELRKVNNVTEVIAVNSLTGSVTTLKSRRLTQEELEKDFSPIAELQKMPMTAQQSTPAPVKSE